MKLRTVNSLILLILLLSSIKFAQNTAKDKEDEKSLKLQKNAVSLLRETVAEIRTLRTIENRITFNTQTAELMWNYDEDEGEHMFVQVADDFIELLNRYNSALNSFGGLKEESEIYRSRNLSDEKSKTIIRLRTALGIRQKIAMTIAPYDGQLAYDFIVRTSDILTDEKLRETFAVSDERIITNILRTISTEDIDKAIAFGRLSLKRKFTYAHLGLLEKIYKKDKKKAVEFGKEIIGRVKTQIKEPKSELYYASYVLETGIEYLEKSKKNATDIPIFDSGSLKELADSVADILIARNLDESYTILKTYIEIRKLSPSAASRLKNRYKDILNDESIKAVSDAGIDMKTGADKMKDAAKDAVDERGDKENSEELTPQEKAEAALQKNKESLFENLNNPIGDKKLSDEEKAKFIREAQTIISTISEPQEKMLAIIGLATRVKQLGDGKLASDLMDEANILVNPQPKNYQDFLKIWVLAGGYSEVNTDKAFLLLEDTVYQLNDTIEAFVKVGEFMDVSGEIIDNNEIQLGGFDGGLMRDLFKTLKNTEKIFANLSKADFDRTKSLADRFNRSEVRIVAKILILKSILKKKQAVAE